MGGGSRLVVSMATIPSRIGKLAPVIDALKEQSRRPDCIYVCIAPFCEWERRAYDVPSWLRDCPGVRVCMAPRDYGPANKLLGVLHRLVDLGNTVVVIEHNLDVVKTADWIVDLGPEGGGRGGEVVVAGTPEDVAAAAGSHTGRYLRRVLDVVAAEVA